MKINIVASSNFAGKNRIIEVASIDEAIKRLQTDRELVESVIDKDYSRVYDGAPADLIVRTDSFEDDCSYEIEIYDYYIE